MAPPTRGADVRCGRATGPRRVTRRYQSTVATGRGPPSAAPAAAAAGRPAVRALCAVAGRQRVDAVGLPLVPPCVSIDDVADQPVSYDVGARQPREVHVLDAGEDL